MKTNKHYINSSLNRFRKTTTRKKIQYMSQEMEHNLLLRYKEQYLKVLHATRKLQYIFFVVAFIFHLGETNPVGLFNEKKLIFLINAH